MEIKFCYIVATGHCTMHEATEPPITEFYQKKMGKNISNFKVKDI